MCYDIKTKLESMLKRARFNNDEDRIQDLIRQLEPYVQEDIYHASGFSHPNLLIYPQHDPYTPMVCRWGLIPHWVKDQKMLERMQNQTLNARSETIFEKSSFRHSARKKRGLLYVDGFYEHHDYNGNKFPYLISRKDQQPIALAALWSDYTDRETGEVINTCSIVTTTANPMMAKIHNNPKLPEPRMPAILPDEICDQWLDSWKDESDSAMLTDLLGPYPQEELTAHTVRKLRGKEAVGNSEQASELFVYDDLDMPEVING